MRRREFIAGLEVAAAWPIVTRAQQDGRVRRIGVLSSLAEDDPNVPARLAAFEQGLQELTWTVGRNIQIDYRFGAADPNLLRKYEQSMDRPDDCFELCPVDVPLVMALDGRKPQKRPFSGGCDRRDLRSLLRIC
jgi:hypothetical protein